MDREHKRPLILLTTSIGAFLSPFTSSSISFAVPEIGKLFGANFYEVIWVPQSFLIALASMILILGRLSDLLGRLKLYRVGFLIFILGAAASIFSPKIILLSLSLFVSGVGAALLGANSTAIISQVFEKNVRGKALGVNAMSVYLGLTLAPILSGIFIAFIGWRSIFYFIVIIASIGLIISYFTMNEIVIERVREKLDLRGGLLFTSFIFSLVISLTLGEIYGAGYLYLIVTSIILLFVFIHTEKQVSKPLMDLSIFSKNRTFLASNLTALLNYMSTFSIVLIFSIYLQVIDHFSPEFTGLVLISEPVFMVIFSPISGILSDRFGSREIAAIGMGLIGASFIAMYFIDLANLINIILPLALIGMGFGLFSAANTNSVMGSVPPDQYGMASGTLGTMRFTGQLISIAIAGAILASSISRKALLGIFIGATSISMIKLGNDFTSGFRLVMVVSGAMSIIGVYTSLMKNKNK